MEKVLLLLFGRGRSMVYCSSSPRVAGARALGVDSGVFGSQICHFIKCMLPYPDVQEYLEHLQKGEEPGSF